MSAPLLALEGLSFGFDERPFLSGLDFALRAGERTALVGANGSGKSTLLRLLVGLHRPRAGRVLAFGAPRTRERDFHDVRLRAGLLFQDPDDQLFCPTVLEDVAFGPLNQGFNAEQARERAQHTLAELGVEELAVRVTHRLSGGEKRLVALAGVLAMRPEVLLLDEPTNGLDEAAERRMIEHLAGLPQAMVLVSHDHRFLGRLANRAVVLDQGRVREGRLHSHPHRHEHLHIHPLDDPGSHQHGHEPVFTGPARTYGER